MPAQAADAQTLLTGLQEEVGIYTKIFSLSNEELQLVKQAELEKATSVLSLKQQQLEGIAVIESRIKPLKDRWQELKADLSPDLHHSFQSVLKQLSDLLERLVEVERETEETLSKQIVTVRKGVPARAAEEQARRAYGPQKGQEGKRHN